MNKGWEKKSLGDCVELISGGTPSKSNPAYWNGDIPWVSCKDMKAERLWDTEDHITQAAIDHGTKLVDAGTTLIVVRGMILAREFPIARTMRPVAFNQDLKALKLKPGSDSRFIHCWLLANRREILAIADEAAHGTKRLQTDRLLSLRLHLPPLTVQRAIARVIFAYDDLIENNTRRIAILEEMARRLFDSTAGGCASSGTQLLGELVCEVRDPVDPSLLPSATPYVGLEHLPRRSTTLREWGRVEEVASLKLRFLLNDILFGKIRPYFHKVAVAPISGVCSSDAIVLRCRRAEDRAFVLSCVSSDPFIAHAVQTSNGTKMPRANWSVLQNWPVPKLTESELRRFSAAVEPMIDLCCALAAQNRRLRAARDLLLPKLISGEIEVGAAPIPEAAAAE
jgi:type I restriction enzyme S subunit